MRKLSILGAAIAAACIAVPTVAQTPKVNIKQTVVTLAAATTNNDFVVSRIDRFYLLIQNSGVNPATLAPGDGPVVAGTGFLLAAGASIVWQAGSMPSNAFSGISTIGTTLIVWEGVYGS